MLAASFSRVNGVKSVKVFEKFEFWLLLWGSAIAFQVVSLAERDPLDFHHDLASSSSVYFSKSTSCATPSPHLVMAYLPKDRSKQGILHFGPFQGRYWKCPVMGRGKTEYSSGRKNVKSYTPWTTSMGATPPVIYQAHPNAIMKTFLTGRWGSVVPFDMHIMRVPENMTDVFARNDFAIHSRNDVILENGKIYDRFSQVNTAGCLKPAEECLQKLNDFFEEYREERESSPEQVSQIVSMAEDVYRKLNPVEREGLKFLDPPESHRDHPSNAPNMDDQKISAAENVYFVVSEHDEVDFRSMVIKNDADRQSLCF